MRAILPQPVLERTHERNRECGELGGADQRFDVVLQVSPTIVERDKLDVVFFLAREP